MEESRGVELYELHVLDGTLGAVDHGDAVAGGHEGIGGGLVHSSRAAGGHDGDTAQEGIDRAGVLVEHIGAVAGDVGGAAGHYLAQMVLGDDLDGEVMLVDVDAGIGTHGLDESALDLVAGVVGMVQDAELRVAALAVEVKCAVGAAVEIHAPAY